MASAPYSLRPLSAGQTLRRATAAAHGEVDAIFSRLDLSRPRDYRAFLDAQARAHLPVEAALDAAGAAEVFADWPARRRAALLRADLAELGISAEAAADVAFADPAEIAGAVYVLEGSRLGGAMLCGSVGADLPVRFLAAPAVPGAWRGLLLRLDDLLAAEDALARATLSARRVFAVFAAAGRAGSDRVHD